MEARPPVGVRVVKRFLDLAHVVDDVATRRHAVDERVDAVALYPQRALHQDEPPQPVGLLGLALHGVRVGAV